MNRWGIVTSTNQAGVSIVSLLVFTFLPEIESAHIEGYGTGPVLTSCFTPRSLNDIFHGLLRGNQPKPGGGLFGNAPQISV